MIFRKVCLLTTIFLIVFWGCDHTKSVLQPVDPIIPLSPEMSDTLMQRWWVTNIDGVAISESLSQLRTLVSEHVSENINISFYGTSSNSYVQFNVDGTWIFRVFYHLHFERIPIIDHQPELPITDVVKFIENNSLVYLYLFASGNYVAGFDTEKQSNVLIFETDKHTEVHIYHENPYSDPPILCFPENPCPQPNIYPAFTADLDWSIFDDESLSKLFSSPLFDTQTDTPVMYTWDMVTSEGTPEAYYSERGWSTGSSTLPDTPPIIRRTIRLYFQGQEDISLRRTDEKTD